MIKKVLNQKADEIEAKDVLLSQIKARIYEEEQNHMSSKKFSFKSRKKLITVMVSCLALVSITVIGSSIGKAWIGHSSLRYSSFPEQAVVQKDIGFLPKYVESLPGGFNFFMGHVGENALVDDVNRPIVEAKSLSLGYKQEGTDKQVTLSAEKMPEQYMMLGEGNTLIDTYKETSLYYYEKMYKFVPESYELTEEDQVALESGQIEISFGTDEVFVEKVQSIQWHEGDILYSIGGSGIDLPVEDLVAMAQTIIDAE